LRSAEDDWDVEIYGTAAATPPDTLEGWGSSIGGADGVSTEQTVQLNATKPLRQFLIWITKLSPALGPGEYRVEVEEVTLNS
jgi:hypothetical protein